MTLRGCAHFLPECSVDPRKLGSALEKAARNHGADFATGSAVTEVAVLGGRATGVRTTKSFYAAGAVVNCAGAWAAQIKPFGAPTRPVKGPDGLRRVQQRGNTSFGPADPAHCAHARGVHHPTQRWPHYPGATVEEAGFDKRVDPDTVQRLQRAAANVAPEIGQMRIHDAWAGLRPGSPDGLPILGATSLPGYYVATGHYRDGILLAPITAQLMTQLITGQPTRFDLAPFSPLRFG